MNYSKSVKLLIILLAVCLFSLWVNWKIHRTEENNHQEIVDKGPKGGHLFKSGDVTLELLVFSHGMPSHFRAYISKNGKNIAPDEARLTVQLNRFNDKKETITFVPLEKFLQSNEVIHEPHSFDLTVHLELQGKQFNWNDSIYEGRIKIDKAMLKAADIQSALAKSQTIKTQLKVVGKIAPNRDTLAPIYARYAGIIKKMSKNLGDEVNKGEVLGTIESNESLQEYTIDSPMVGTIVQKNATNGELTQNTKPIYEVANLDTVWADFTLYRKEAPLVKKGQEVMVTGDEGTPKSISSISYIAPLGIEDSQTTMARAVLANDNRIWLPGMYVNAAITINEKKAPVAVLISAIQRMEDKDVVFVQQGEYFEATPVVLGDKNEQWVEILSGLDAGQRYVSKNSFFIKAEIGKAGASHED